MSDEIQANLKRAEESLIAAKELFNKDHFDFAASRAYYASFYAATALLLKNKYKFGKHSGVIAAIHKYFVKEGKLDPKFGKDLNWLFEVRGVADYGETLHVSKEEVREAIRTAESFFEAVKQLM